MPPRRKRARRKPLRHGSTPCVASILTTTATHSGPRWPTRENVAASRRSRRRAADRPRRGCGDDPRRPQTRRRHRTGRIAHGTRGGQCLRRGRYRRALRRRRGGAGGRRRAHERHPRARPAGVDAAERAAQVECCARCCWRWSRISAWCCSSSRSRPRRCASYAAGRTRPARQVAREMLELYAPLANRLGVWRTEVGTRGPVRPRPGAGDLQENRRDARRAPPRARAVHRGRRSRVLRASWERRASTPKSRAAEAHLQHLEQDAAQGRRVSTSSTTSAPCASSSTTSRTATRRSASCITCGRRSRGNSTTTSRSPRRNDYRSLHTAVLGPEGKPLEVQIRTREMHQHAELGVAAHWRYKEGGRAGRARPSFDEKIAWLRQLLTWKDEVADVPTGSTHSSRRRFTKRFTC